MRIKRDRVGLKRSNSTSLTIKWMLHFGHHVCWQLFSLLVMYFRYSGELKLRHFFLLLHEFALQSNHYNILELITKIIAWFYRNAQNAFYKVLLANAATSALRLHQRMPRLTFTREYFALLLVEDSCHYLFFSTIFLYVSPFILILLPVVLFAILHAASYSLTLLDVSAMN